MSTFSDIKQSALKSFQGVKSSMGLETKEPEPEPEPSALEEISGMCPKLTFQQRLYGFVGCFGLGYIITFGSFSRFAQLLEGDPVPFVLFYTAGNILSMLASMFLCGPARQLKNMFDEKRKWTTIIYLSSLVLTIVVAFLPLADSLKLLLLVVLLITQFCASIWYCLSYIPYGRRTAAGCCKRQLGLDEEG